MKWACKPGSVPLLVTIIHLEIYHYISQATYPKTRCEQHPICIKIQTCFPIWSCTEWGLPCHELLLAMRCALTAPFHPYQLKTGGFISAALAVNSRCPAVSWHSALRCPDFPPSRKLLRDCPTHFKTELYRKLTD